MSIKLKDTIYDLVSNSDFAKQLKNPRTIWGQSFDGTGNIVGSLISDITKDKYRCTYSIYYHAAEFYASNIASGEQIGINFGKSYAAKQMAYIGYKQGSTDNESRFVLGLHSVDDIFNLTASGNIGIGTTNPSSKLDVQGDIYTSSALKFQHGQLVTNPNAGNGFIIRNGSGINIGELAYYQDHLYLCNYFNSVENSGIEFKDNGDISLFTKSGKPLYIKGNNIGMGTTEPEAKLHITSSSSDFTSPVGLTENKATGSSWYAVHAFTNPSMSTGEYTAIQIGKKLNEKNCGHLSFYYAGDQSNNNRFALGFYNVIDLIVAKADGNVGIGTTNPGYKLHVNGSFSATSGYIGGNTILTSGNWSSYCAPASHSHNYLSLSGGTLSADKRELLRLSDTNTSSNNRDGYITFHSGNSTSKYGAVGINTSVGAFFEYYDGSSLHSLHITNDGYLKYKNNLIYHAGNFNPSNYLLLTGGTLNITSGSIFGAKYAGDIFGYNPSYGTYIGGNSTGTSPFTKGYWIYAGNDNSPMPKFCKGGNIYKIWCEDNDGSGSGLNADLLDGKHASEFSLTNHNHNSIYSGINHNHDSIYLKLGGGILTGPIQFNTNTDGSLISNKYSNTIYETLRSHNNGNISLSASSGSLYLGYQNTQEIYCRGNYINIDSGNYTSYCATSGHTHSYLPLSGGALSKNGRDLLTLTDTSTSTDQRGAYITFHSSGTSNRLAVGYNSTTGGFFEYYRSANNKYYSLLIDPNGVLKFDNNVILNSSNWSSYIKNYIPNNTGSTITGGNSYLIIGQTGSYTYGTPEARKLRLGLGTVGHTGSQYWSFCVDDTTGNSYLQIGYTESSTAISIRHDGLVNVNYLSIDGETITFTT